MSQNNLNMTVEKIANELQIKQKQVEATIRLLDDGATVPFIARYRKEVTEGLNDNQLRELSERLFYLRELDERREVILNSLREQEKLTSDLETAVIQAETKTRLEDLYLPFRPKRRTKALLAKEAGLEPLALDLWKNPTLSPEIHAQTFINVDAQVETVQAALEGAQQILMEQFAEHADLLDELREYLWQHSVLSATAGQSKKDSTQKYADYMNYAEPIKKIPSHRALALFRGRRENALQISLNFSSFQEHCEKRIMDYFDIEEKNRPADPWLLETVRQALKTKIATKIELELFTRLREVADEEAIRVFATNLHDLLLTSPAGAKITIGLDPGIRTGVKVVVIDATGKLLDYTTIFPFSPQNQWQQSITDLAKLAAKHKVELISIGNGTGSRETERLVQDFIKMYPDLKLTKIVVSEAGASVYSASELAAQEFPDLDVTIRGAVSIARRLQDPLAELVKIDPKSIGVGQYQHDINQTRLARCLDGIVEDCVNAVGVDVNRASVQLLTHVSGLNEVIAKNLVQYRDEHGSFQNRQQLKLVPRIGDKTFLLAAGFLRITDGDNPLDASGVHPEAYPVVEKMLQDKKITIKKAMGNQEILKTIAIEEYVNEHFGLPTLKDILVELEKPGRDPRPEFKTAQFKEGVEDINHLQIGMILEGVVSNVTNFGAFVDIGVHQDGLIHISAMTDRFIDNPRSVVKTGNIVTVRVTEVDSARKRIGLSMLLTDEKKPISKESTPKVHQDSPKRAPANQAPKKNKMADVKAKSIKPGKQPSEVKQKPVFNTAMADALSKLKMRSES